MNRTGTKEEKAHGEKPHSMGGDFRVRQAPAQINPTVSAEKVSFLWNWEF